MWVAAGTYVENVTLKAGVSAYGGFEGTETDVAQRNWLANRTILDGNQTDSVVTVVAGATADTRIDGFTIRNGSGTSTADTSGDTSVCGAGIYCLGASPTIINNTITGNSATGTDAVGGGIYCASHSSPIISSNTIAGNSAYRGGGIYSDSTSTPTISNNVIRDNKATATGAGGIHCLSSAAINGNTISGNIGRSNGGGIYATGPSPTILNNRITGNIGTGIYCSYSPMIAGNTIMGNTDSGIYCDGGAATIANNTIVGNNSTRGGGISCVKSSATIVNTIVAFNASGICRDTSGIGTLSLRSNCVYGNTAYDYSGLADPTGTNGNICVDPHMSGALYGNVHIEPDSLCIDAGDDSVVPVGWVDMDGQARTFGSHVDIGADESDGTVWPSEPPVVVRVSLAGDDANDGSSWTEAKRSVQAGIEAAAAAGGEVWVKAGTYTERIVLRDYAHVYGGFAGVETHRSQRDRVANMTVLDGGYGGSVIVASFQGAQLCGIDGFVIRHGAAAEGSYGHGGGIYCESSSPTITNNIITTNTATDAGGGISCLRSSPLILNNVIISNSAPSGGGISCGTASPTIANNVIIGNSATGISCGGSLASPLIVNNTVVGNSGTGISCDGHNPPPVIANTIVAFNSVGIYANSPFSQLPSLHNNCVYGNSTQDYAGMLDPTGTNGNISADPDLAATRYGNMHIQPDSPCVNAGDDTVIQEGWVDLDRQTRVIGPAVDIGADESDGTVWEAIPSVIVRVAPEGNDANDGSSWSLAKRSVQESIDTASALGGEVWVKAGIYAERIVLRSYAHVYGGFTGTETQRSSRDWATNVTALDGGQGGSVVTAAHILPGATTLDGFTVRNGSGTLKNSVSYGGGVYSLGASPMLANDSITGNSASYGAGIWCDSSATIANSTITGNHASESGGGIYCDSESVTVANNTIVGNVARSGGGVQCSGGPAAIANTIIAFNSSGIFASGSTDSLLYNCVYGNSAYNYCPAIADPTGTNGNISADPVLAYPSYVDVHIQPDSPCVDAGDDALVLPDWADMDAQARIIGSHVDIGADESDGTAWPSGSRVIVRVRTGGNDDNDGATWDLAKRTVQAGIDVAARSGGQVWVAAGTYAENILIPTDVAVYGGFAGTEADVSERDWRLNHTVLDGHEAGSVVAVASSASQETRIDGFTIRNGIAPVGAGVCCSLYSAPTVANNIIEENTALTNGGGIYCDTWSSPTVAGNIIRSNSTSAGISYGAGIYCNCSAARVMNNTITANCASGSSSGGGGMYLEYSASPAIITNNTITGNSAVRGGGIFCYGGSPTIANTIVACNSSGICGVGGSPSLRYNCVYGNASYDYLGLTDPTGSDGNISAEPRLAGPAYGNNHIQLDSPCVDAGDDGIVQAGWSDVDGQMRISGDHVDIGADESDGAVWREGPAVIVHVAQDGNDANDGLSWNAPKRTVQTMLSRQQPPWAGMYGSKWEHTARKSRSATLHTCMVGSMGRRPIFWTETGRNTRLYWMAIRRAAS